MKYPIKECLLFSCFSQTSAFARNLLCKRHRSSNPRFRIVSNSPSIFLFTISSPLSSICSRCWCRIRSRGFLKCFNHVVLPSSFFSSVCLLGFRETFHSPLGIPSSPSSRFFDDIKHLFQRTNNRTKPKSSKHNRSHSQN